MDQIKVYFWTIFEIFIALIIGTFVTQLVIRQLYEMNGIQFSGNVSVILFSVSFIIYCIETLVRFLFKRNSENLRKRISGYTFWGVFVFALILLIIPLIKGEIPY